MVMSLWPTFWPTLYESRPVLVRKNSKAVGLQAKKIDSRRKSFFSGLVFYRKSKCLD